MCEDTNYRLYLARESRRQTCTARPRHYVKVRKSCAFEEDPKYAANPPLRSLSRYARSIVQPRRHAIDPSRPPTIKVEVKAAALHAVASVLGPSPSTASTGDDEVMGNTAAAAAGLQRSSLARQLFERVGTCNRQPTGALLVGLARQPVPEARSVMQSECGGVLDERERRCFGWNRSTGWRGLICFCEHVLRVKMEGVARQKPNFTLNIPPNPPPLL